MVKKFFFIFLGTMFLLGCSTFEQFKNFALQDKAKQYRYCALAVMRTSDGRMQGNPQSAVYCSNGSMDQTKDEAVKMCEANYRYSCMPMFTYDRYYNSFESLESSNITKISQQKNEAYMDALRNRCDAFGFQRATEGHSECMLKLNQQIIQNIQQQQALRQQQDSYNQQQLMQSLQLLQQNNRLIQPQSIPNNNINCQSTRSGNTVNTNCW